MPETVYVATKNTHKLKEISDLLKAVNLHVKSCAELGDIAVSECGDTFLANAREKLRAYLPLTDEWLMADDSGLEVPALGGAPGIYSARYSRPHHDKANNEKLLRELSDYEGDMRKARFVCAAALGHRGVEVFTKIETVEGRILHSPRGNGGFGYDPLFYYPDYDKTFAEMSQDEKNHVSHRGKALHVLSAFIRRHIETCGSLTENS